MEAEAVSGGRLRSFFQQAAVSISPRHAAIVLRLQVVEMKKMTILPWIIWFMLIIGMIMLIHGVAAQDIADTFTAHGENGDYVRIKDEPCPNAPEWLDLRLAEMRYHGKEYKACWFRLAQFVIVLDDSKDKSPIPINAFKKDLRT